MVYLISKILKNKISVFSYTVIFVILLAFNAKVHAQEKFTLSAGVTLPVPLVNSNYNSLLGYKIEFLKNFKIFKSTILSTGQQCCKALNNKAIHYHFKLFWYR